ncbi:transcriptional regulator [Escherichia coli]|uniref:Putative flagellar transcriptional activator n=1 Tax=Edwardsiella anguillarum ET080813 TaxID=667120 RepID=A0A076LRN8_9GAMM|nr:MULTISPECIES: transcriptional regulator [Edwardsiella]EFP0183608.1 transcriptional regulator [Escherichia coli]AIJ10631.1 putative flagellar transcriptional activator [Edwardsiella anguillarum ET080813]EKS7763297.1 transcriptional regulator [Edwardsiella ictaluri]EKS7789712.1 transcriptional regulator [Edwardsiella ictaluri]EKS7818050.1 transcriptional regulator [Edwardsiella ictaluri]
MELLEQNIIEASAFKAVQVTEQEVDRNVYEFDMNLWSLLCTLAKENPVEAATQFCIGMDIAERLAQATHSQICALASGVVLSFRLETPEHILITRLNEDYDPMVFINQRVDEFDAAYWLLFNRIAIQDIGLAKEVFGVSNELAELVAKATDSQLRHMSGTTLTHFTLRFSPTIIGEILDQNREDLTQPVLKKLQQSLKGKGR